MAKVCLHIIIVVIVACAQSKKHYESPTGYDFNKAERFTVPESLNEVSGICFWNQDPGMLYAQQDEEGKVFYLRLGEKKAKNVKFAKGGDYEDIAIMNNIIVVMRSDGNLFTFPLEQAINGQKPVVQEWEGILPEGEYEGMCADPSTNELLVLCKDCDSDETDQAITAYILEMQRGGKIVKKGRASVNVRAIAAMNKGKKLDFHPSGLAKNPTTGELFIISAVNNLMVITENDWTVKEVCPLDPSLFRQPEGIAFDNKNNLYISNEGDELSTGNVLRFAFKTNN